MRRLLQELSHEGLHCLLLKKTTQFVYRSLTHFQQNYNVSHNPFGVIYSTKKLKGQTFLCQLCIILSFVSILKCYHSRRRSFRPVSQICLCEGMNIINFQQFSVAHYRIRDHSKSKEIFSMSAVLLTTHRSPTLRACNFHDTSHPYQLA